MTPRIRALFSMFCSIALAIFSYFHNNAGASYGFYFFVICSIVFLAMSILFKYINIRVANILFYVILLLTLVFCNIFLK